jgi:hypothetical protein
MDMKKTGLKDEANKGNADAAPSMKNPELEAIRKLAVGFQKKSAEAVKSGGKGFMEGEGAFMVFVHETGTQIIASMSLSPIEQLALAKTLDEQSRQLAEDGFRKIGLGSIIDKVRGGETLESEDGVAVCSAITDALRMKRSSKAADELPEMIR